MNTRIQSILILSTLMLALAVIAFEFSGLREAVIG